MASAHSKFDDLSVFFFCVVYLNNKNVHVLIASQLSGFTCTRSLTMNSKVSIPHSENFSFIVGELEQVYPDNSLAECVNQ